MLKLEDLGGFHPNPALARWSPGSCFENEGRFIYNKVRELRPEVVVEIGRWEGCSTSYLALACAHNGFGKVYSIDINVSAGGKIPDELRPWIEFVNHDIFALDPATIAPGKDIGFLLEDAQHTTGMTRHGLTIFKPRVNGVICVHDWFHWDCQKTSRAEAFEVLGEPTETYLEAPSDCGYGVWKVTK